MVVLLTVLLIVPLLVLPPRSRVIGGSAGTPPSVSPSTSGAPRVGRTCAGGICTGAFDVTGVAMGLGFTMSRGLRGASTSGMSTISVMPRGLIAVGGTVVAGRTRGAVGAVGVFGIALGRDNEGLPASTVGFVSGFVTTGALGRTTGGATGTTTSASTGLRDGVASRGFSCEGFEGAPRAGVTGICGVSCAGLPTPRELRSTGLLGCATGASIGFAMGCVCDGRDCCGLPRGESSTRCKGSAAGVVGGPTGRQFGGATGAATGAGFGEACSRGFTCGFTCGFACGFACGAGACGRGAAIGAATGRATCGACIGGATSRREGADGIDGIEGCFTFGIDGADCGFDDGFIVGDPPDGGAIGGFANGSVAAFSSVLGTRRIAAAMPTADALPSESFRAIEPKVPSASKSCNCDP